MGRVARSLAFGESRGAERSRRVLKESMERRAQQMREEAEKAKESKPPETDADGKR
jgi:hypothetical protein